jgi:hypothetical protein
MQSTGSDSRATRHAAARLADHRDDHLATVQAAVSDETVLAVGILSRPGSLLTTAVLQVSTLGALVRNASAKKAAAELPQNVVVAITDTRVLFFSFRPRLQSIVLKELVRSVPRAGLRIRLEQGPATTRVVFTQPDGSCINLDTMPRVGSAGRLTESFMAELV